MVSEYGGKAEGAFLTIGELSAELGVPPHILRYWESRFPQLKPLQRAGKRRYYRPEDVALAHRIHDLLDRRGYTIRGAQKALADKEDLTPQTPKPETAAPGAQLPGRVDVQALRELRDRLTAALSRSQR